MGFITDYHHNVMKEDPQAGRELIKLNKKYIDNELRAEGHLPPEGKPKVTPTKAVRKLDNRKKKKRH